MSDVGAVPWLAVAAGGAVGACLRFGTTVWIGVPTMPAWPWATLALGRSRPGPAGSVIVFMRLDYLHTCSIILKSLAWDLLLESVGSFAFGLD